MPQNQSWISFLLAFVLFSTLTALAFKHIFSSINPETERSLRIQCPARPTNPAQYPYRLTYTGITGVDMQLCTLVTFFRIALKPSEKEPLPRLFTAYFLAQGLPGVAFWVIETWKYRLSFAAGGKKKSMYYGAGRLLTSFTLWGALFQNLTGGVVTPLFCMAYLCSGMMNYGVNSRGPWFTKRHAEAVLFGLVMGALVPSVAMFKLDDPRVTAAWQFFPLLVSGFKNLYVKLRPPNAKDDGRRLVVLIYVLTGVLTLWWHISTAWPALGALVFKGDKRAFEYLRAYWFPAKLYGFKWASMAGKTLEFLHWDALFCCVSGTLATFWFAETWSAVVVLAMWYSVMLPLLGPGLALASVFIWRELRSS